MKDNTEIVQFWRRQVASSLDEREIRDYVIMAINEAKRAR